MPAPATRFIRFPVRRCLAIWIVARDGAWLVLAGAHGWLHGDRRSALAGARWLSRNLHLPVREVA